MRSDMRDILKGPEVVVLLLVAAWLSPISLTAEPRPTVGFATSDSRFLAGGSEVTGHVTVFEGESVTSGHLPTRLNLQDGWRFLVGIGSRVQISRTALQLDGGSLDIIAAGKGERALHAAGLRVLCRDSDTKASIYISRADAATVSVESGEISVVRPNGEEVRTLAAGSMATFTNTRDDVRINETDAAFEIGEIQAEQIKHLGKLGELNSGIGEKAGMLLGALAAASGGLIGGGGIPGASPPSSPGPSAMAPQPMVAADGMSALSVSVSRSPSRTAAGGATGAPGTARRTTVSIPIPRGATRVGIQVRLVRGQVNTTVWRGLRCGINCRFGIPIVTTHIFFFPVVGGIIRPFCIQPACSTPPPFRN